MGITHRKASEKNMTDECPRCGQHFTEDEQKRGYQVCKHCYQQDPKWWQEHINIQKHIKNEVGELKKMVSMSRKGKPHKQPWGFHIIKT